MIVKIAIYAIDKIFLKILKFLKDPWMFNCILKILIIFNFANCVVQYGKTIDI